jgi:quercetin dioxygenase-like cupin family protein
VNGKFCKDPKLVNANDFFFQGLNIPLSTANPLGTNSTLANVDLFPGLNTLGLSIARIDYAPYGVNPPHTHPRASELLLVVEGAVGAGFVTSDPDYRFFTKILYPGDIFIFPIGLIHFNFNVGKTKAVAFASFGSQNPGVIDIPEGVFGSNPPINPDFLAKSFQVDKKVIELLEKQFN